MPDVHSNLPPSASKMWISCPPSAALNAKAPDSDSSYALAGTLAHSIGEAKIRQALGEDISIPECTDAEMAEATDQYRDYVLEQIEAARALGMSFSKIMKNIVIPQALRSSVLSLTNLLVATMLTTALASQVPLNPMDLTGLVSHINTHAVGGVTAFLISAVLYCATAVVIGQIGARIDRKVRILR